jgi:hypothetical protein
LTAAFALPLPSAAQQGLESTSSREQAIETLFASKKEERPASIVCSLVTVASMSRNLKESCTAKLLRKSVKVKKNASVCDPTKDAAVGMS